MAMKEDFNLLTRAFGIYRVIFTTSYTATMDQNRISNMISRLQPQDSRIDDEQQYSNRSRTEGNDQFWPGTDERSKPRNILLDVS